MAELAHPRWNDYVLRREAGVKPMIAAASEAGPGRCTLIAGEGFDPRGPIGPTVVSDALAPRGVDLIALGLPSGRLDEPAGTLVANNLAILEELGSRKGNTLSRVPFPQASPRNAGLTLSRRLNNEGRLPDEGTVIVDVSSLPSSVAFPVIASVLEAEQQNLFHGQLVVLVSENAELDRAIEEEGADDPGALGGFHFESGMAGKKPITTWTPLLGEGQLEQLTAIHRELRADQIIPILPFPAANPRRADGLITELQTLLFEEMQVEPSNLLYADESNPFDVYRSLCRLSERYETTFSPLGGSMIITSVHGSKLLAMGVLLAAWERRLPVVSSVSTSYSLALAAADVDAVVKRTRLTGMWLLGQPYQ